MSYVYSGFYPFNVLASYVEEYVYIYIYIGIPIYNYLHVQLCYSEFSSSNYYQIIDRQLARSRQGGDERPIMLIWRRRRSLKHYVDI